MQHVLWAPWMTVTLFQICFNVCLTILSYLFLKKCIYLCAGRLAPNLNALLDVDNRLKG